MENDKFYTQINYNKTLIASHSDIYPAIKTSAWMIIISGIFAPLFLMNSKGFLTLITITLSLISIGFSMGLKCKYIRCSAVNTLTRKIKIKQKFIWGWRKYECNLSDTILHAKFFPETSGYDCDVTGTAANWEVMLVNKFTGMIIMKKCYFDKGEMKLAMKSMFDILYPTNESISYDDVFEMREKDIYQIRFE